jgi:hypothetical protein
MALFEKIILVLAVFSSSLFGSEFPIKKSGELFGILTSKGQAWIEVKEDEGFTHRYLSPWHGGSPTNGGGFDQEILGQIEDLVVGNRAWLSWYWDGHLRVKKLRVIKPMQKNGVFEGYLLEKGENWFDVRSGKAKTPWRFYARWVGGLPEDGGGYDTKNLGVLDEVDPNLPIRFSWIYDFRPRLDKFIDDGKDDDAFVPFYEGKKLSRPYFKKPSPPSPNLNPFDTVNPPVANPFDTVNPPVANPFDQAKPSSPFDSVEKPKQNPTPTNPFDSVTPTEVPGNPFDKVPLPGNPFDTLEKPEP